MNEDMECNFKNKRDIEEIIDDYLYGRLSEAKMKKFEEHYFSCAICTQKLRVRQELIDLVKDEGEVLFAEYLGKKAKMIDEKKVAIKPVTTFELLVISLKKYLSVRWLPAGLAVIAVFLLIVLGKDLLDSPDLEEQRMQFAANSTPSPFMESLLNQPQRAANVLEVSPPDGFNVQDELRFSWQRDDTSKLFIIILNNRVEELFTFSTTSNEYLFKDAADKLQPGLYYWKLEDKDELRYVGKFFVKKP